MKKVLGTDVGSRHSPVDLSVDISVLMRSLAEHDVYKSIPGRKLDEDDAPTVDAISEGLSNLLEGSALDEYNASFIKLQNRRRVTPIINDGPVNAAADGLAEQLQTPSTSLGGSVVPAEVSRDQQVGEDEGDAVSNDGGDECLESGSEVTDTELQERENETQWDERTLGLESLEDVALEMDMVEEEEDEVDEEDDDEQEAMEVTADDVISG